MEVTIVVILLLIVIIVVMGEGRVDSMLWPATLGKQQGILEQSGQVQVLRAPKPTGVRAGSHGIPMYTHRLACKSRGSRHQ